MTYFVVFLYSELAAGRVTSDLIFPCESMQTVILFLCWVLFPTIIIIMISFVCALPFLYSHLLIFNVFFLHQSRAIAAFEIFLPRANKNSTQNDMLNAVVLVATQLRSQIRLI